MSAELFLGYCRQNAELQLFIVKSTIESGEATQEEWHSRLEPWLHADGKQIWSSLLPSGSTGYAATTPPERARSTVTHALSLDLAEALPQVRRDIQLRRERES